MKNIFNRFVFLIAFCGLFVSCSNFSTSFYNEVDISKGKGKICISTDLQASRSVLPTAITDTTTGLKWELNGTKDGTQKQIQSWVDDTDGTTAYKKMVADTSIFVDVGEWKFTLTASTAGKNVLNATISATINAGENSLNFEMQEAIGENAATGSIEFTLNFPKEVVDKAIATLYKYGNDDAAVDTNRQLTINESSDDFDFAKYSYPNSTTAELKSGYYILKIELQQSVNNQNTTINTYSCLVRVAPGLTSKGEYTLDKLAQLYTVTYEVDEGIFDSATTVTTSYNEYTTFALPTIKEEEGYEYQWYKTVYDIYSNSSSQESVDDPSNVRITEDTTFGVKCYKIVAENDIFRTAKGDSTRDTFSIGTAEGLAIFRDLVNGCNENLKMVDKSGETEEVFVYYKTGLVNYKSQLNAKLTSDIDLTQLKDANGNELSWVPINGYSGTFDGGGHTITVNNTYYSNEGVYYQGLFDTLDGATIKNLVVAGEETISESGLDYCGGIVSQIKNERGVDTTFENCVNKRNITVTGVERIGGFAGYTSSNNSETTNFVNCINLGTIENNYNASEYYDPYVAGFTTGAKSYTKCINAGNVTGATFAFDETTIFGTVAGFDASGSAIFTDCINLGNISANSYTGSDGKTYSTEKVYGFSSIENETNKPSFMNCIDAGSANCPFTGVVGNTTGTYVTSYYNSDSYGSSSSYNADYAKTSDDLCKQEKINFSNWSYDSSHYPLPKIEENFSEKIWQEVVAKATPKVSNFTMLKNRIASANETADNPDVIVLNGTINIAETLEIKTPIKIIASTSAGTTITRGSGFTGEFFNNTSTLTLEGITLDGGKNSNIEATAPLIISSETLTLNNCTLQNNTNTSTEGGAIYISNGTFTMSGGTISGCSAEQGGGVYVEKGTFTMTGGTISENKADCGGGIYLTGTAQLIMTGGEISGNSAYYGGGVHISGESSKFAMKGGEISGNSAEYGGGVAVDGLFFMSGGTISGNKVTNNSNGNGSGSGSGVYVAYIGNSQSAATFEMSGGAYVNSNNDVYLAKEASIKVTGNLTGTTPVATITPDEYSATRQVLVAGSGVALSSSLVKQFNVTPDNNGNEWFVDLYGYLGKVPKIETNDDGTDVYLMESYDNLLYIARGLKTGSITSFNMKLTNDIEIPSGKWQFNQLNVTEASTIDGQGHSITIDEDVSKFGNDAGGLFYKLNNSTVKNLVLKGSITANTSAGGYIGALCRSAYRTTIQNVMSTVEIIDEGSGNAGGLVGYFGGNSNMDEDLPGSFIQNCAVYANVTSKNGTVGGLVGGTWSGYQCWQINNCIYAGTVAGETVGAIIGTHNTGRDSTFKDTWYYANGTSEIVGKYNNDENGENFDGYDTVISKTAEEFAPAEAATLLGDAWEYVGGAYPTLKL